MTGVFNINRRRFGLAGGIGLTALMVVLATLLMTGAIFASMPLAGVGGFVVAADKITGSGFELLTNFSDINLGSTTVNSQTDKTHNKIGMYPEAMILMDSVTIYGLELSKLIDTRPFHAFGLPDEIDYVKIMITADGNSATDPAALGSGLVMNATRIETDQIVLNTMLLEENMKVGSDAATYGFTSDHLLRAAGAKNATVDNNGEVPIGMKANNVDITVPAINGHYMTVDSMTLKNMNLWVQMFGDDDIQVDPADLAASETGAPAEPWDTDSNM